MMYLLIGQLKLVAHAFVQLAEAERRDPCPLEAAQDTRGQLVDGVLSIREEWELLPQPSQVYSRYMLVSSRAGPEVWGGD